MSLNQTLNLLLNLERIPRDQPLPTRYLGVPNVQPMTSMYEGVMCRRCSYAYLAHEWVLLVDNKTQVDCSLRPRGEQ